MAACAVPPAALQPLGGLRGGELPATNSYGRAPAGDPSGNAEVVAMAGTGLRQLEGRLTFLARGHLGAVTLFGGGGLLANATQVDASSTETMSELGGMPVALGGIDFGRCAITAGASGGALPGPTVMLVGGVAELGGDCTVGPWTFGARGLAHTYSSGAGNSGTLGATAVASFRPRWQVFAPTVSVLVSRRDTHVVETPQGGGETRYDEVGWLAGIAIGMTLEPRRR